MYTWYIHTIRCTAKKLIASYSRGGRGPWTPPAPAPSPRYHHPLAAPPQTTPPSSWAPLPPPTPRRSSAPLPSCRRTAFLGVTATRPGKSEIEQVQQQWAEERGRCRQLLNLTGLIVPGWWRGNFGGTHTTPRQKGTRGTLAAQATARNG
jgi:hypothetical protein